MQRNKNKVFRIILSYSILFTLVMLSFLIYIFINILNKTENFQHDFILDIAYQERILERFRNSSFRLFRKPAFPARCGLSCANHRTCTLLRCPSNTLHQRGWTWYPKLCIGPWVGRYILPFLLTSYMM